MPSISTFFGITIRMYYQEHEPAHLNWARMKKASHWFGSPPWSSAMGELPAVIEAEYLGGYRIHLRFEDGRESAVDFASWLVGPMFEPLRDGSRFREFVIDGGTVAWPNGADIAPETLYRACEVARAS